MLRQKIADLAARCVRSIFDRAVRSEPLAPSMGFLLSRNGAAASALAGELAERDDCSCNTSGIFGKENPHLAHRIAIFRSPGTPPAGDMFHEDKRPLHIETQEVSRTCLISNDANRIWAAVRCSTISIAPWQQGHFANCGGSGSWAARVG